MFQNAGENSAKKLRARGTCTKTGHQGKDLLKSTSCSSPVSHQRFTAGQILFVVYGGCGEKDGGPFFSYHRTAQHSLGRICTLKVFELQREEWYPGNLLEPTRENIQELCNKSSAHHGLKQKYKSFYLKEESAVLQRKPKANEPGE